MILNDLKATAGSTGKQFILKHKADTFDKKMFQYAYDMDKMFNLKFNSIDWKSLRPFSDMDIVILDKLLALNLRGNQARDLVNEHCIRYGDLIKMICNKDLDCGVTATTLNKVFGKGFIPVFEVQLAEVVEIEKVTLPVIGQLKYNGVRVTTLINKNGVIFKTRNGKTFQYPMLKSFLECITDEVMLDGELTIGDSQGTDHTDVSGVVNSAIKGTPITKIGLVYHIFDAMPLDEFNKQECNKVYSERFRFVNKYVQYLYDYCDTDVVKYIQQAETYTFDTHEDINQKFEELLARGYEGLILKHWNHKYTFKRSKDWIKVKAVKDVTLRCHGVVQGTGKYEGQIGALLCIGEAEGKQVIVKVGSGLNDKDRAEKANYFLDAKIDVLYNAVIQDKVTGEWSLFLPRYKCIRGDI